MRLMKVLLLALSVTGALPVMAHAECSLSVASWQSQPFALQSGAFQASWDAMPLTLANDGVMGLSAGVVGAYTDLAAIVRFNVNGSIDAMNGTGYTADQPVIYTANNSYHFRLTVSVPAHSYSVFVTPPGQAEIPMASNYAFRSPQAAVSSLSYLSTNSSVAPTGICNFGLGMTTSQAVALADKTWGASSAVSVALNEAQAYAPWYCVGQTILLPVTIATIFGPIVDPYAGTPNPLWWGCGASWEKAFMAAGVQ
jgi:hypothetical protein